MSKVKYALTTLALSLLVLASNAHADIRVNGGSVLVSTGDSISKRQMLVTKEPSIRKNIRIQNA